MKRAGSKWRFSEQQMDKLIKTLPAILRASGASEEVSEACSIAAWKHAVGEGLSGHAVPVQLLNHTLIVVVADNIWKRQLEQMRGQFLFRLNAVLGQPLVKSIELRVDPKTLARLRGPGTLANHNQNVNYQAPAELLSAAAEIDDVQLRRAFLGAAASCVRRLERSEPSA
jgi:predicted nucleic acid-binding Zn ribbon protein